LPAIAVVGQQLASVNPSVVANTIAVVEPSVKTVFASVAVDAYLSK
jgi:hypothetical protein